MSNHGKGPKDVFVKSHSRWMRGRRRRVRNYLKGMTHKLSETRAKRERSSSVPRVAMTILAGRIPVGNRSACAFPNIEVGRHRSASFDISFGINSKSLCLSRWPSAVDLRFA